MNETSQVNYRAVLVSIFLLYKVTRRSEQMSNTSTIACSTTQSGDSFKAPRRSLESNTEIRGGHNTIVIVLHYS